MYTARTARTARTAQSEPRLNLRILSIPRARVPGAGRMVDHESVRDYAYFDGRLATGLAELSHDPAVLDGPGWWAVVGTFEGRWTDRKSVV